MEGFKDIREVNMISEVKLIEDTVRDKLSLYSIELVFEIEEFDIVADIMLYLIDKDYESIKILREELQELKHLESVYNLFREFGKAREVSRFYERIQDLKSRISYLFKNIKVNKIETSKLCAVVDYIFFIKLADKIDNSEFFTDKIFRGVNEADISDVKEYIEELNKKLEELKEEGIKYKPIRGLYF